MADISHVIVDEVHERSIDSDFLLTILKGLLKERPELKVVLMSATMDAEFFASYFGKAPVISIPGKTFEVEKFFLEDVLEDFCPNTDFSFKDAEKDERKKEKENGFGLDELVLKDLLSRQSKSKSKSKDRLTKGGYSNETVLKCALLARDCGSDPKRFPFKFLIRDLVQEIDKRATLQEKEFDLEKGAILVFLPGFFLIKDLHRCLNQFLNPESFHILPLHGMLSSQNQQKVFKKAPRGKRKVVLATNIAESSITIDDVVYVIDSCRHKETSYDKEYNVHCLMTAFISRSSADQRRGRAGRVRPGKAFHLISRYEMDHCLEQYAKPEILRCVIYFFFLIFDERIGFL